MERVYLSPMNESYGLENFYEVNRSFMMETEIYFNNLYIQETYAEEMLLTEAIDASRNALVVAIQKFIHAIESMSRKFMTIVSRLVTTNKAWVAKTKVIDVHAKVDNKFTLEIFPYWRRENELRNFKFPEFQETPEFMAELNDVDAFQRKYFKQLYLRDNQGKEVWSPMQYFQGGYVKVRIDKETFLEEFENMISYVETFKSLAETIDTGTKAIGAGLRKFASEMMNATLPADVKNESNQLLATINMLLEQGEENTEPATTSTVEKTTAAPDAPASSKTVDPNAKPEDKRAAENKVRRDALRKRQEKAKQLKDVARARKTFDSIRYAINSSRMSVAESCYNAYVWAIHSAVNIPKDEKK